MAKAETEPAHGSSCDASLSLDREFAMTVSGLSARGLVRLAVLVAAGVVTLVGVLRIVSISLLK